MTTPTEEEKAYQAARERAEAIQGMYIHLLVYVVINAGIFGINWVTTGGDGPWWFYWPLFGWGIGLGIHLLPVITPVFSSSWVDNRTERIMNKRYR